MLVVQMFSAGSGFSTKYTVLPSPTSLLCAGHQRRYSTPCYRSGQPHPYEPERKEDSQHTPPQDALPPHELPLRIYHRPDEADGGSHPPQKPQLGQHRPAQMRLYRPLGGGHGCARESGQHLLPAGGENDVPLWIHFDVTNDHLASGGTTVDRHKPMLRRRVKGCLPRMGHMTDVI